MANKKIVAASLVLNMVLAVVIAAQFLHRDQPMAQASAEVGVPAAKIRAATDPEQEKILTLATLEADARAANPPPHPEFWKAGDEAVMDVYLQKMDEQLEAMRQALLRRFGPDAADDPLFARLFKPLNIRFPYLSSRSQLALVKLQRTRRPAPSAAATATPLDPAGAYLREQEFNQELRAAISKEEYDEYQLRESLAARQLRASGVATTEPEFRAAFSALEGMNADRSASGYLAGQERLRDILGPRRFAQYSASRDPNFAALQGVAGKHNLTREQTLAVYEAIYEAQMQLVRGGVEKSNGLASSGLDPQQVSTQRDQKVASIAGDDIGRELIDAYSNAVIAASLKVMNQAR